MTALYMRGGYLDARLVFSDMLRLIMMREAGHREVNTNMSLDELNYKMQGRDAEPCWRIKGVVQSHYHLLYP